MYKEKLLHAQIQNPLFVRKTLLESAIISAELVKSFHNFKKTKTKENKEKSELRALYNEMKILINKLEEKELPPLAAVKHEKIKKIIPKERLIKEEGKHRKRQEKILEKEKPQQPKVKTEIKKEEKLTGIDLEISKLKNKIKNL